MLNRTPLIQILQARIIRFMGLLPIDDFDQHRTISFQISTRSGGHLSYAFEYEPRKISPHTTEDDLKEVALQTMITDLKEIIQYVQER